MRLLRGLTGELLPCGCLVGVYETDDGRVVAMIDARGAQCDEHRLHGLLRVRQASAAPAESRTGIAKQTR